MKDSQNWFIRRNGVVQGPYPAGLVSRYILLQRIRLTDLVSRDRREWLPAGQVSQLVPEVVRQAMAHPDDEEILERLAAARRWADERHGAPGGPPDGRERRQPGSGAGMVMPAPPESGTSLRHRQGYLAIAAIILLLLILPWLLPGDPPPEEPQCESAPLPGINWRNCRLEGREYANADLAGANLASADLTGTVLRAANLTGASLAYANLTMTNLRGANLTGASLKGASLHGTDLFNASLQDADLSYAHLAGVDLASVNLAGARLDRATWMDGTVCRDGSIGRCLPPAEQ